MSAVIKQEQIKLRVLNFVRKTVRDLVKFDSLEAAFSFLVDSFRKEFDCDIAAILLKEDGYLVTKELKGGSESLAGALPLPLDACNPLLLEQRWDMDKDAASGRDCAFSRLMRQEGITHWYTSPIKDDERNYGFCVFGFRQEYPLFANMKRYYLTDMERIFSEFGKDVAVAITTAQHKEADKKKLRNLEWINREFTTCSSLKEMVEKLVEQACAGTQAESACIYLFYENTNSFVLQSPAIGFKNLPDTIRVTSSISTLSEYFPFLERLGENQLTVPLAVHFKMIGVLHAAKPTGETFGRDDLDFLTFLASHIAPLMENARMYEMEIGIRQRLRTFMGYHQELVKQTVEGQNFDGISFTISNLFTRSVILLDRFFRPISSHLWKRDEDFFEQAMEQIRLERDKLRLVKRKGIWLNLPGDEGAEFGLWPVVGGGDLLGYLVVNIASKDLDDILQTTLEHALNVYAIQFIKQKLVMDAKEQVKDSFIHKLLEENLNEQEKIIEYANLFRWDLFQPHRVGVFKIQMDQVEKDSDLLDLEARKSWLWDQFKEQLSVHAQDMIMTRRGSAFILIVPVSREEKRPQDFWQKIYNRFQKVVLSESQMGQVYLGVGSVTQNLEDYYVSYKQASQALNVVASRFGKTGFALFDDLGAYTLLYNLKDPADAVMFVHKYLSPLISHPEGKRTELFHTLQVFLEKNGHWKATTDALFIHRSTLKYRLEKIQEYLGVDLDDAEQNFNLMLACKLYHLYCAGQDQ